MTNERLHDCTSFDIPEVNLVVLRSTHGHLTTSSEGKRGTEAVLVVDVPIVLPDFPVVHTARVRNSISAVATNFFCSNVHRRRVLSRVLVNKKAPLGANLTLDLHQS